MKITLLVSTYRLSQGESSPFHTFNTFAADAKHTLVQMLIMSMIESKIIEKS